MNKILIIGQAPSAVKQAVPYDTTMLYEVLSWAGVTKEQAQEMFDFEACYDKFPGFDGHRNHKPPTMEQFRDYLDRGLRKKILDAKKILFLGKVAVALVMEYNNEFELDFKTRLMLPHPSYRNAQRIKNDRQHITDSLKEFLKS